MGHERHGTVSCATGDLAFVVSGWRSAGTENVPLVPRGAAPVPGTTPRPPRLPPLAPRSRRGTRSFAEVDWERRPPVPDQASAKATLLAPPRVQGV